MLRIAIVLQTLKSAVPSGSAAQGPYNVQRIAFRHTLQNLLGVGSGFRKAELRQAVRDFRKDVIALRKLLWKTSVEVANRSMGVGSEHPAGWESLRDDLIELGTELNRVTIRVTDLVNTLDQYKVLWTKIVTAKAKASATVEQAEYDAALAAAEKQGPGRVFDVKMQKLWNKKDYGGLEW